MLAPGQTLEARAGLLPVMTVLAGVTFGGAVGGMILERNAGFIRSYLLSQDTPVLLLFGLFFVALVARFKHDVPTFAPSALRSRQSSALVWIALTVVCGLVWAGSHLVYRNFALSADEFMVDFDARIFATGRLLASVAPEWRAYVPALQPMFRLELPENAYWISSYLPMNAAIRALFVVLGEPVWHGVALAGVAIVAVFGVARRLWPDRPDASVVAVILLACSSQFLITAMSPYAMTAHLALNMVWLWFFLRDTRAGHLMAAGVAFVACGLHQVIFHPLFAAPFVLSLLVARRWKLAGYYAVLYAAIGMFWILYWSLVLRAANAPMAESADIGILQFMQRIADTVDLNPGNLALLGLNLLRFLVWQSPLAIPLVIVGLTSCRARKGIIIELAAGIALTLALVLVLMPFQGHGWGYRYLHGFLGSFSLIAAQGWIAVTDRGSQAAKQATYALAASVLVSLLVLLPWRAYQVRAFVDPYASAIEAIRHADADVVLVDPTDIWYGEDLARNDPFLKARPKILSLPYLDETQLADLCRRYDVAVFDRDDARRFGIPIVTSTLVMAEQDRKLRRMAHSWGCGHPIGGQS